MKIHLFSPVQIYGQLLVVFSYLLPQVAAACVDDQIIGAIRSAVYLDKVVSTTQCPQAPHHLSGVPDGTIASQRLEVKAGLPSFPDIPTRGDEMSSFVQALKVDLDLSQRNRIHPAPNIYTNNIGDSLIRHRHSRADGASFAPVYVRHHPDLAPTGKLLIAHSLDLLYGLLLNGFCIT